MTIRDIAKLANVSVSSVSKVLNGKDDSISQETRDRIKRIAEENNYTPYAEALSRKPTKLLGVLYGAGADFSLLVGISSEARRRQYNVIVSICASPADEKENMAALVAQHVDGIIFVTSCFSHPDACLESELQDIPLYILDEHNKYPQGKFFSYDDLGFKAAQYFVDLGHRKIACVSAADSFKQHAFANGIRRCLFENGLYTEPENVWTLSDDCNSAWIQSCTGIICLDSKSMGKIAHLVEHFNLHITKDLSVISLCQEEWTLDDTRISKITCPYEKLGRFSVDHLINQIEHKENQDAFVTEARIDSMSSLAPPSASKQRNFVVVGMANMDTLISVDKQLEPGETVSVRHRMIIPGGKGLNQSLGIVKLGETASLIASLGSDLDGRAIFECLKTNAINTSGVSMHSEAPSGHAYIYVQEDSESSISVYGGANEQLTISQIDGNEALFADATCCLLQTEVDQAIILHAAELAKKHGVQVILKPCTISRIDSRLLQCVDILVPNQKEARKLLPQCQSVEEQADYFFRRGVKTTIITLGAQGCYKRDRSGAAYFPAVSISPVDATGAADSFIATLAVYLSRGRSLNEAIKYATCAAGLSTTRHGVPPSLVDMDTLETFYAVHYSELQEKIV